MTLEGVAARAEGTGAVISATRSCRTRSNHGAEMGKAQRHGRHVWRLFNCSFPEHEEQHNMIMSEELLERYVIGLERRQIWPSARFLSSRHRLELDRVAALISCFLLLEGLKRRAHKLSNPCQPSSMYGYRIRSIFPMRGKSPCE